MLIKEILQPIRKAYKDNFVQQYPPTMMLYHSSLRTNKESILQKGLLANGVCQLYGGCKKGVVYLATSPKTSIEFLDPEENPGMSMDEYEKNDGYGTMFTIDPSKLNPELWSKDKGWERDWWSPKDFAYKYQGNIPASAIIKSQDVMLNHAYYMQKQVTA